MPDYLLHRAEESPDALAYRFLADGEAEEILLTWSQLLAGSQGVAAGLAERGAAGEPVLITAAPGPGFLHSLFGAWLAGAIAVPAYPPRGSRHRARLEAVRHDCGATLCLGELPKRRLDGLDFLDPAPLAASGATFSPDVGESLPCLLQYTSGSTSSPKGVALHHSTLAAHLDRTHAHLAPLGLRSLLSWLPPYHDMGLVLKILHSLRSGVPLTWFSPDHFVQRPARWLRAIQRFGADMSGGPNFAYEWCLRAVSDDDLRQLDLSSWRFAPSGAERVRLDTLQRFAKRFEPCGFDPRAFCPGYGLAEATLVVTTHPPRHDYAWRTSKKDPSQVSCGTPLGDAKLRIVDPETRAELAEGETGEIEVSSGSVAAGYWQRPEETAATFVDGWLRTGDRGFLEDGHLYVVGRIKDLIILDGVNLAPEDLETAASSVEPRLAAVAAFAIETPQGETVALAAEARDLDADPAAFCVRVRAEVSQQAGVPIRRMLLVRPGLLPRTTSGKIQRHAVRAAFSEGSLPLVFDDGSAETPATAEPKSSLDTLLDAIHRATGREGAQPWDDLATFGVSSIEATRIAAYIQQASGVELDHADLFNAANFGELAAEIDRRQPGAAIKIARGSGLASGLVSHSQERMGFLHRLAPDSAAYHVFGTLELSGPLDREALEKAYLRVLAAHPILRTRHAESGMSVSDTPPSGLEILEGEPEKALREFAAKPFDLAKDAPVRTALVARGPESHVLGLCAHHIVADGWSTRIIVRQLAANYEAYRSGSEAPPLPAGPDFIDYAAWQRQRIDAGAADAQIDYWKRQLDGHSGKLEIATDFARPPRASSRGSAVLLDLPAELDAAIDRLARERRVTPFMIRFAAWMLTLRAHGGGDDIVSAVPVANRHHAIAGDLVGTLVNTLPLRLTLGEGDRFLDLIDHVRTAALGMQKNQEAPFEKIIEAVKPERSRDRAPIAQVMFDHQELPLAERWAGGLSVAPQLIHRGAVQFDLALVSFRLPDRTQLILEYRSDLFREDTARAMLDRFVALLRSACEAPETDARALDALSENDRRQLDDIAWGPRHPDYPAKTTPALVADSITRFPDTSAFRTPEKSLSFADLGHRSDALAASLRNLGIAPGDRVALMLDRTPDLPCALLAIWKCGAAYLPLDPNNPADRLALILDDQAPIRVLVSPGYKNRLPAGHEPIELTEVLFQSIPGENATVSPADPAYILYTSGSTGKPKGVVIPHGALANFLLTMADAPGMTAGETLLAVTTVSFDISGLELFLPLVVGATVDLVDSKTARDASALRKRFETSDPDLMQATPATWRMLLDAGWQGSKKLRLLCGGEALDLPLAQKLRPLCAELWNLYGPTETTIWSTIWPVPHDPQAISIGRPIANTSIRILSPENRPTPPGVPGELLIGGDGLATGYWQRDELTADRFVTLDGERLYRTGDLAKWLPDGNIECLGRTDSQVKVRGFRVELGEIDTALLSHPEVEEAATALVGDRLVGWFRSAAGLEPKALSDHLKSRLPDYMVPAPLVPIDSFPLTASGKIDRKALAARPLPQSETHDAALSTDPLVQELTAMWAEILGLPQVAPDDDFFALGGHSLLAARLATAAGERTGLQIPLDWLFDRPTPAGMAERLRTDAATDLARPRAIPLTQQTGGTPLFWVHTLVDGGMGLLPYRETARMLADITNSYGIAEGTKTFSTLSDLAAAHVQSIRSVQPHGPYRLAGFCFGGNVAAEIAAQLTEAGETIELLALLEASPPSANGGSQWWRRWSNWQRILKRLPTRLGSLFRRDPATMMRRLKMKQRAASSKVDRLVHRDKSIPDLRGVLDLDVLDDDSQERAIRHWEALHRHTPRLPAAERLVLIRALDEGWLPRDPNLGWKPPVPFEIYSVSGRHEEFLRHHSAREVATILRGLFSSRPNSGP
ncbi:amino acid adenylation domain-containing protein [Haloferula sargassicola]|uniref:amino acid adenylation domain-containing protein n=1 Tax=Haloferula sargassicola TaxID=490096 RepID=UPI0033655E60